MKRLEQIRKQQASRARDARRRAAETKRENREVRGPVGDGYVGVRNFVAAVQDDDAIASEVFRFGSVSGRRIA